MRLSPPRLWRTRLPKYRLLGCYCEKCNHYIYPPRPVCPYCGSPNLRKVELPRRGTVETYTIIHTTMEGFRSYAPLILAIVKLENGARVLAPLTDVEPENVREGMCVEAVIRRVHEDGERGLIAYAVKFRPCLGGG